MHFHSLKFDIHSNSIDVGGSLARLYRTNDLSGELPRNAASLTVQIERWGKTNAITMKKLGPGSGTFAETNLLGGMCWFADGRFYSACDGEFACEAEFIPSDGCVRVNVGGRYDAISADGVVALVVKQIMQSFVLPFYRLKFLHGAVVARNGATLMLTGSGGAGKSTTALRMFVDGYTLLSDDGPLFTRHDGKTVVLSSLDFCQVTSRTLELIPELADGVVGDADHRGKYRVQAGNVRGESATNRPRRVTHLVQLDRRECREPVLTECAIHDVIALTIAEATTVFRSPAFAASPVYREHSRFAFDVITGLADNVSAHRLTFAGRHLDEIPSLLAGLG